jgi:hypothetical protein
MAFRGVLIGGNRPGATPPLMIFRPLRVPLVVRLLLFASHPAYGAEVAPDVEVAGGSLGR